LSGARPFVDELRDHNPDVVLQRPASQSYGIDQCGRGVPERSYRRRFRDSFALGVFPETVGSDDEDPAMDVRRERDGERHPITEQRLADLGRREVDWFVGAEHPCFAVSDAGA